MHNTLNARVLDVDAEPGQSEVLYEQALLLLEILLCNL